MQKVTITLEHDILQFVDQQAKGNRSAYINALLAEYRRRIIEAQMINAIALFVVRDVQAVFVRRQLSVDKGAVRQERYKRG